jgi:ERCC4-type nuclease
MDTMVKVVVDDREARGPVIRLLRAMPGVGVSVRRLERGDYEIDGQVLFERKTLPDLALSIADGRLFRQALRLASSPKRAALVLEGTASDLAATGMRREAIQGAMVSLALVIGLPILRSTGPEETARLMLYAARQLRRVAKGTLPYRGYRPRGKRKTQLRILQDLPGVGAERAVRLLDTFGSVEAVMTADEEELAEVRGIGYGTARRITQLVRETGCPYEVAGTDPAL